MQRTPDSVTEKIPDNRESVLLGMRLDGRIHVTHPIPRHRLPNAKVQGFTGDLH
ncbi:hypothetical protein D3C85_1942770 [compost metagenome]